MAVFCLGRYVGVVPTHATYALSNVVGRNVLKAEVDAVATFLVLQSQLGMDHRNQYLIHLHHAKFLSPGNVISIISSTELDLTCLMVQMDLE
jgi:hypothetical protein